MNFRFQKLQEIEKSDKNIYLITKPQLECCDKKLKAFSKIEIFPEIEKHKYILYNKYILVDYNAIMSSNFKNDNNYKVKFNDIKKIEYINYNKHNDTIILYNFINALLMLNNTEIFYKDKQVTNLIDITEYELKNILNNFNLIIKTNYTFNELHEYFKNYYNLIYVYTKYKRYCIKKDIKFKDNYELEHNYSLKNEVVYELE